jgi:hypothetical protein
MSLLGLIYLPIGSSRHHRRRGPGAVASEMGQGGHRAPLSEAREIGVRFNHELPTGCAEVLSINGSVGAHGGSAFFKNHEALSAAYRHTR